MLTAFDKFIVSIIGPSITTAILSAVAPFGITDKTTFGQVISIGIGAILVWAVPNKK